MIPAMTIGPERVRSKHSPGVTLAHPQTGKQGPWAPNNDWKIKSKDLSKEILILFPEIKMVVVHFTYLS